jgi:hypothetical protein
MQKYILPSLIAFTALAVSATAAFYSVTGLGKLFTGAAVPVMIMASVLELSKLVTATLLHNYWTELKITLKIYLSTAVIVLVLITSLGIYGFLTAAYQQTSLQAGVIDNEIGLLTTNRDFLQAQLSDLTAERTQLVANISELRSALGNNKVQYKDASGNIITTTSSTTRISLEKQLDQSISRQTYLTPQIDSLNKAVYDFNIQITGVQNNAEAATELGPLKYVASITELEVDRVVNYLILIIVFVFDPLAISLVLAANFAFSKISKPKQGEKVGEDFSYYLPSDTDSKIFQDVVIDDTKIYDEQETVFEQSEPEIEHQPLPLQDELLESSRISRNVSESTPRKKKKISRSDNNKIIY